MISYNSLRYRHIYINVFEFYCCNRGKFMPLLEVRRELILLNNNFHHSFYQSQCDISATITLSIIVGS
ncbi:Uncharacterised protein [Klebsiella variicola]|nr:hypothetical protein A1WC_00275 [Klebsiella sp. KTE92]MBR8850015.1 hypothetical protein [Klebsiella variicola]SLP32433.1 Uncharacterised protein [Klebsiella variicola]SXE70629.1 Uncharacterised protein [Klebsiella variicola]SXF23597.1 Uncharacterised protein [Klebsiella variicola]